MKRIFKYLIFLFITLVFLYFGAGFYVAYQILKIDYTCGLHEGSLPNTWSTSIDSHQYTDVAQRKLRENFNYKNYYLDKWQDVYFLSRYR